MVDDLGAGIYGLIVLQLLHFALAGRLTGLAPDGEPRTR